MNTNNANRSLIDNKTLGVRRISIPLILMSLASLVVISYFGILIFDRLKPETSPSVVDKTETIEVKPLADKKYTATELIDKNGKYVMQVFCRTIEGDVQASGVVIGRDMNKNLIVLTNYHVIENLKTNPSGVPSCNVNVEGIGENEYYYAQPTFYSE